MCWNWNQIKLRSVAKSLRELLSIETCDLLKGTTVVFIMGEHYSCMCLPSFFFFLLQAEGFCCPICTRKWVRTFEFLLVAQSNWVRAGVRGVCECVQHTKSHMTVSSVLITQETTAQCNTSNASFMTLASFFFWCHDQVNSLRPSSFSTLLIKDLGNWTKI